MANFGNWGPHLDTFLRTNYGVQSSQAIARTLTEMAAAILKVPTIRITAKDVDARAAALQLGGRGAARGVRLNVRVLNRLAGASPEALKLALDKEIQRLFVLLTGASESLLVEATALLDSEKYRRKRSRDR